MCAAPSSARATLGHLALSLPSSHPHVQLGEQQVLTLEAKVQHGTSAMKLMLHFFVSLPVKSNHRNSSIFILEVIDCRFFDVSFARAFVRSSRCRVQTLASRGGTARPPKPQNPLTFLLEFIFI